ncbi:fasciclin domain-containing protein [Actomonas aquatica]|uniref:Fasciclin domain-containing protein n=1 Tax=Actomonas aquatica TaxID=2866162 RepID=A0ABZ1C2Z0_9BACT|nr:fasciclin domain-containing protein [Opitutus sp. WL0086]WRQ85682.1 fasciclin domain-containing protein [Opitutus sp. WL0086]
MKFTTTLLTGVLLSASPLLADNHASSVEATNVSTRGLAGTGENTMISGVVVEGPADDYVPVLFRGLGPTLADFGLTNVVTDPAISVYAGATLMGENDNWMTGGQSYAIRASGYAPTDENESAMLAMMVPGAYTVHLHGHDTPANGLLETFFIEEKNIPANLVAAGEFTTLVAAVQAAGLDTVLSGAGPFTLFAPTDEAFAKLPAGTVEGLLNDIPALTNILLYHVVSGQEIPASAVATGPLMMANGVPASLSTENGAMIDNANIIEVDWMGTNGTIHVIDEVILPGEAPSGQTIVENLVAQGNFETLVAAVTAADLVDTLNGAGPFTLFAPTDAAFAKLPEGTVESLLQEENIPTLRDILLYHVISGTKVESSAVAAGEVSMANGDDATLSTDGGVMIETANVTGVDWQSSNGVIHIIDTVILPPM